MIGRNREREKIRERVSAYLDGELPPEDAAYVGRRIQEDPTYARVYAAYRGIRMDLRALAKPEMPPGLSAAIRAQAAVIQPRRAALTLRQRVARITAAAATLVAAMAAFLTGGFGLQNQFAPALPSGNSPTTISVQSGPTTATVLNPTIRYDEAAQIQFTRPMNEETVKNRVLFSPGVAPSLLQYDSQRFILSTKPKALIPDTRYTVQIPAGLKDAEGNDVSPAIFSFSVGNVPGLLPPSLAPATVAPTATALTVAENPTAVVGTATAVPVSVAEPVVTATNEPAPSPATEPPAAALPTPTPRPAVARPTNPPAPAQPASRPAGTVIAAAEPTATTAPTAPPTPPTATAAPTVAPTATPARTVAPTATTPAIPVAERFKGAYAALANRLGEPLSAAAATTTSQVFFQNGFMVYVSGQPIYVFFTGGKTYTAYPNPGNSGAGSEGGPGPTAGLYKPKNAFGVLWVQKNLQGTLGYATQANETGGAGTIQQFEGGTILSLGSDVYVLLKNGSWQPFSG